MSDDVLALLIEDFFRRWLRSHPAGVDHIRRYGLEAALDHLFRLLNEGHVKIASDAAGNFVNVVPIDPPEPPTEPLLRPGQDR